MPGSVDGDSASNPIEIVLAVVCRRGEICVARRSERVATSRGLWSVVTGYMEPGMAPLAQTYQEIAEELGFQQDALRLARASTPVLLTSPTSGKQFLVHPFVFDLQDDCDVVLNWEHTEHAWVRPDRLAEPDCVAWQHELVIALIGAT
jgi:8-oxo-dGTP pyrophosphatase MutT (NUDIX family)